MLLVWLSLAIAASVAYHLVLKVTPGTANPFLTLAATYVLGAIAFLACYTFTPDAPAVRDDLKALNWTAVGLAVAVVGIDIAFLMLYRSGFAVALGQNVTQSATALILLIIGVVFFREKLSGTNLAGIAMCVAGLWLVSQR
jgi:multidrug transporter EmrE-like cation transporter